MAIEIVDFPINSMVDLSIAKCKRSPEGIQCILFLVFTCLAAKNTSDQRQTAAPNKSGSFFTNHPIPNGPYPTDLKLGMLNDCYDCYPLVIEHSHGIDGPFIDGLPIKTYDFPWLC